MPGIDPTLEPLVREGFAAVVARDADRLKLAIEAIPDEGVEGALRLGAAVDAYLVRDLIAEDPTASELDEMADNFVSMEDWFPLGDLSAHSFFQRIGGGGDAQIDAGQFALLIFLTGGWLLSAFLPDGKNWFEYLDEVLGVLDHSVIPPS